MDVLRRPARHRWRAGGRLPLAVVLAWLLGSVPAVAQGAGVTEPEMKAAFLFKFGKFVDWPGQAFDSPSAPLELCVIEAEAVAAALEATVRDKTIAERRLHVQRLPALGDMSRCHLVFVGAGNPKALGRVAERLATRPALIVAEAPQAAGRGAVVNFVLEANRIRFEINPAAAARRGLRVSSKLLSLARLVGDANGDS